MRVFVMLLSLLCAGPAVADVDRLQTTAKASFARMPDLVMVDRIAGNCGADDSVNEAAAYCTTTNQIFVARADASTDQTLYLIAHLYGHAVQVQHGVADFALDEIRNRPSEETMLRGLVELQVDCIAGFLIARARLSPISLQELFDDDPLAGPHWGRNPLRIGPARPVDLALRAEWFDIGQAGDIAACAPGEFSSALLIAALR
ncbi:MAG: hypothetical protein AAGF56_11055 [Pseudomonadota bacterium]